MTFYSLFFHDTGTMLLFAEEGHQLQQNNVCSRVSSTGHELASLAAVLRISF